MKIGIISDHRGYHLKKDIINTLIEYNLVDLGTDTEDANAVDYPDYAFLLGEKISNKELDLGVAICGTGIGICIALNKVKKIRCAKVDNIDDVIATKSHNNANVISFNATTTLDEAKAYIKNFIETPFSNEERHKRRIDKITQYEEEN